jgi:Carboxypeptidase regulatory-like domain
MLCSGFDMEIRLALFAAMSLPLFAQNASLTGSVVDSAGAYVAHADVELDSGNKKFNTRTDDSGGYQFLDLPRGEYTLTFTGPFSYGLTIKPIGLSNGEVKRIPEITLTSDLHCQFSPRRDVVRLLPESIFGKLSGSVLPAEADVKVTLICRTFRPCGSTKTDSGGHFSFEMLTAGAYALSFLRDGFYPEDPTGYEYYVNAGLESVYVPVTMERCSPSCEARVQRILPHCE